MGKERFEMDQKLVLAYSLGGGIACGSSVCVCVVVVPAVVGRGGEGEVATSSASIKFNLGKHSY